METSKIALIVIILLLITGGVMLYFNNGANQNLFRSMTTIPQVGQGGGPDNISGTPTIQSYSGDIVAVSFSPLKYKDAIPVTIHQNGVPLSLYITEETNIYTDDNKLVPRSYLREGMIIQAQGMPINEGIDVSTIRIVKTAQLSVTISPTLTTSPSPIIESPTSTITPEMTPTTTPAGGP